MHAQHMPQKRFRCPDDLWQQFQDEAHRQDRNASAILRRLLAKWLQQQQGAA